VSTSPEDEIRTPIRQFVAIVTMGSNGRVRAWWRFVLGLLVVLFANFGAQFLASAAGYGRRFELAYRPLGLLLALGGFAVLSKTIDEVEGNPLPYLGLRRKNWRREVVLGLLLGFGMILLAVLAIAVLGQLTINIKLSGYSIVLAVIELIILAAGAMMEEIMFRGYPFQRLVESIRPLPAVVVLSTLFGLAHFMNPHVSFWAVANTAAVGVLLCVAYLRTGALWMPFGLHFAWNTALGLVFGLPVSGLKTFSVIVRSKADGPIWLTGGSYGIEASVVGTVVIVMGTIVLFLLPKHYLRLSTVSGSISGAFETAPENPAERIQL
jgi:membrane protease YdiL (CAAX protease family)